MEEGLNKDKAGLDSYTREELIDRIKELEDLVEALKEEKNQEELLKFSWIGNLGHWYWNVKTDKLICNDKKITTLGYEIDEIAEDIGFEFFTSKLHPEDYERVMDDMRQHLQGNKDAYEVEYRIQTKDGKWKWYYDRGMITKTDGENEPIIVAGIVFDITKKKEMEVEIHEKNKKLLEIVNFDHLTQLLTRRALFKKLREQILKTFINKSPLSVIMMDIDKFKLINDTYGHLVGDSVIKDVAEIIKGNLSENEFVGRYGGEEFLIVLPACDKDRACKLAEKIREDIANKHFSKGARITISGGVGEYNGEKVDMLLNIADLGLYEAKNDGRNKIVCI